jgi:hypothetical protein
MKSPLTHFIIAAVVCLIVIAGYCAWYSVISAKSNSVANLQSQIDTETETASRAASARAAVSEIESDEATVHNYFVPETGVVAFINNLEEQGQSEGTTVDVLSVSTGTDSLPTLSFSLTIEGTFDAVMRTVGAIEYSPYDLSISEFSINQDEKSGWQANLGLVVGSVNSATSTSTP